MAEGAKESWCQSAISRLTVTESSILFCNRFWKVPISPYLVSGILGRILHMKSLMLLALPLLFVPSLQNAQSEKEFSIRPDLSKSESISKWDLDGTGVWSIGSGRLILSKAGIPAGPIRRPGALAILKMKPLRSVSIEADIRSTASPDVARRDLDFVVGYESAARFYYIHLSATSDDVHNGIFLVNNADRVRIDSGKGKPQLTDFSWHRVRVERDGRSGRIAVYLDGSRTPVLLATDTTIVYGRAGLGSFDDTGEFRNIFVKGYSR